MVPDVIGVQQASDELGLSTGRIRHMLESGLLDGTKVGCTWAIDPTSVRQAIKDRVGPGRPWSCQSAWDVLYIASAEHRQCTPQRRIRAKRRLLGGLGPLRVKLHSRGIAAKAWCHPGRLADLLDSPHVVRSGISTTAEYNLSIVALEEVEGYIPQSCLDSVFADFRLVGVENLRTMPNVILRAIPDHDWPFERGRTVAPPAAAAMDLLDAIDPRSNAAARALIRRLATASPLP